MHIVMLTRSTPLHSGGGGMEAQSWDLAQRWVREGHKVTCITTPIPERRSLRESHGVTVEQVRGRAGRYSYIWWISTVATVRNLQADVIFGVSAGAHGLVAFGSPYGVRVYMQAHGTAWEELATKLQLRSLRALVRIPLDISGLIRDCLLYKKYTRVISVGPRVSRALAAYPPIWRPKSAVEIPNGYSATSIDAVSARQHGDEVRLLFVGRLHEEKGVFDLLHFIQGRPATLTLVGEGPAEDSLRQLVAQNGQQGTVVFTGRLGGEELSHQYLTHDVCVVPSRRREGLPMVILESLAHRLPVVVPPRMSGSLTASLLKNITIADINDGEGAWTLVQGAARMEVNLPDEHDAAFVAHKYLEVFREDLNA